MDKIGQKQTNCQEAIQNVGNEVGWLQFSTVITSESGETSRKRLLKLDNTNTSRQAQSFESFESESWLVWVWVVSTVNLSVIISSQLFSLVKWKCGAVVGLDRRGIDHPRDQAGR